MKEVIGIVENGQVRLPPVVDLPDGLTVKVVWDERDQLAAKPYDREGLTGEEVKQELQWTTGKQPHDLRGIWRDRFPSDFDLDVALGDIRREWEREWPPGSRT